MKEKEKNIDQYGQVSKILFNGSSTAICYLFSYLVILSLVGWLVLQDRPMDVRLLSFIHNKHNTWYSIYRVT